MADAMGLMVRRGMFRAMRGPEKPLRLLLVRPTSIS